MQALYSRRLFVNRFNLVMSLMTMGFGLAFLFWILFTLFAAQSSVRHGREPDIRVEADLVAEMSSAHRAAARLSHVADQEPVPSDLGCLIG